MCVCVGVYTCKCNCPARSAESVGPPGAEVTGGCKALHPVDDRSQTWVLFKRQDLITEPPLQLG